MQQPAGPLQQLTYGDLKHALSQVQGSSYRVNDALAPLNQVATLWGPQQHSTELASVPMIVLQQLLGHVGAYMQHLQSKVIQQQLHARTAVGYIKRFLKLLATPVLASTVPAQQQQQLTSTLQAYKNWFEAVLMRL